MIPQDHDDRISNWFLAELRSRFNLTMPDDKIAMACGVANSMTASFALSARIHGMVSDEELDIASLLIIVSFIGALNVPSGGPPMVMPQAAHDALNRLDENVAQIRQVFDLLIEAQTLREQKTQ